MDFSCEDNTRSSEEDEDDDSDNPSLTLYAMENSMGFCPRHLSFANGQVVKIGRRDDVFDPSKTGFFKNKTVLRSHAELFFRDGDFYVR